MSEYEKLVNDLREEIYSGKTRYDKLLKALDMYVIPKDVQSVYPKNWKIDDRDLELIVFENDRFAVFKNNMEHLVIEAYKYSEICKLEIYASKHEDDVKLTVHLRNNSEPLLMRNKDDTNFLTQQHFAPLIKKVFQYLKSK